MADGIICLKTCPSCKRALPLTADNFGLSSRSKSGLRVYCKECSRKMAAERYRANREKINAAAMIRYSAKRKEKIVEMRDRYRRNAEKYCRLGSEWRAANPQKRKEYGARYYAKKCLVDPSFRLARNIRWRLRDALANDRCSERTFEIVGYSVDELRRHIERQFIEGMNWNNYGINGWHIDHIVPMAMFDHADPKEVKACWSLTNLRPLWASANAQKGAKRQFLL